MKKKRGKKPAVNKAFYFMVVPFMILFFLFHTIPFLQGLFYSFTDWKGYGIWNTFGTTFSFSKTRPWDRPMHLPLNLPCARLF